MYLTITIYLKTNPDNEIILHRYKDAFITEVERIASHFEKQKEITFYPYKNVSDEIAFYSKNQTIHFAEILYKKRTKMPYTKCLNYFSLSAKSFRLESHRLVMNFGKYFSSSPLYIAIDLHPQQQKRIASGEIVKMDVKEERRGYFAKILIHMKEKVLEGDSENVMGIDIGMRCPAVCYTSQGKICFIGNGREIRFHNRKHNAYLNRNKNNAKKLVKFNHKARKYKNYIDHCISKKVIDFAIEQNIGVVKLEKLTNLQRRFYSHEQVCWSYERLQTFIKYKAEMMGIKVIFVDPRLTSKRCPRCGKLNNVRGRNYDCPCGFHKHRDIVGAMNIMIAPEVI